MIVKAINGIEIQVGGCTITVVGGVITASGSGELNGVEAGKLSEIFGNLSEGRSAERVADVYAGTWGVTPILGMPTDPASFREVKADPGDEDTVALAKLATCLACGAPIAPNEPCTGCWVNT